MTYTLDDLRLMALDEEGARPVHTAGAGQMSVKFWHRLLLMAVDEAGLRPRLNALTSAKANDPWVDNETRARGLLLSELGITGRLGGERI